MVLLIFGNSHELRVCPEYVHNHGQNAEIFAPNLLHRFKHVLNYFPKVLAVVIFLCGALWPFGIVLSFGNFNV